MMCVYVCIYTHTHTQLRKGLLLLGRIKKKKERKNGWGARQRGPGDTRSGIHGIMRSRRRTPIGGYRFVYVFAFKQSQRPKNKDDDDTN